LLVEPSLCSQAAIASPVASTTKAMANSARATAPSAATTQARARLRALSPRWTARNARPAASTDNSVSSGSLYAVPPAKMMAPMVVAAAPLRIVQRARSRPTAEPAAQAIATTLSAEITQLINRAAIVATIQWPASMSGPTIGATSA